MSIFNTAAQFLKQQSVSEDVQSWLLHSESLTARLKASFSGEFDVRVKSQHQAVPTIDEQLQLSLTPDTETLIREVGLYIAGKKLLDARTIIPLTTLQGPAIELARLGNKPLGHVIFSDPSLQRTELEIACDSKSPNTTWSRRSLYLYLGKPLLVAETFVDGFDFTK